MMRLNILDTHGVLYGMVDESILIRRPRRPRQESISERSSHLRTVGAEYGLICLLSLVVSCALV